MPDSIADGQGQVPPVPQSPDSNGQVPPVSQAQSTASDSGTSSDGLTLEQARDALKKAREEAAKHRVDSKRLAELEAAEAERANAALSEKERYEKQKASDQARIAELETKLQEVRVGTRIDAAAVTLGISPALAHRILDWSALTFGENGDPTNVAELLAKAVADYGIPTAETQQQQQTPTPQQPLAPAMSATNPSRASQLVGANGHFNRNDLHIKVTDPALWKK